MVRYCSAECQKSHWETHKKDCKKLKDFEKLKNINEELPNLCDEVNEELPNLSDAAYESTKEAVQRLSKLNPVQEQCLDEVVGKSLKNKRLRELWKKAALTERENGPLSMEHQVAYWVYEQALKNLINENKKKYDANLQSAKDDSPAARGPPQPAEDDSPAARGPPRSCYIFQFVPEELHGFVLDTILQAVHE